MKSLTHGTAAAESEAIAPPVTIVVVTYNGRRFLQRCLGTLLTTQYADFHIVLVDNGSSDGSGEYTREHFPDVEIVRKQPNAGYAAGVNFGIRHALEHGAEYVAVFNDDTAICDPRWLAEAIRYHREQPDLGVVGFMELAKPAGADHWEVIDREEAQLVNGFALVFSGRALARAGLYDEVYFIYCDEDDLQARLTSAGYRLGRLNLPIYHHGSGTTGRISRGSALLQMRNGLRLCLKHRGLWPTMLRLARILDVACNPWPRTLDPHDVAHVRMRNSGNVIVNAWLAARAVGWNVLHLRETFVIARAERRRAQWPGDGECDASERTVTTGLPPAAAP